MKSSIALLKVRDRLNKRSSQANKNIRNEAIQESVNKVVLELCRRFIKGKSLGNESAEETKSRVSDLQVLLKNQDLSGRNKSDHFESLKIPSDFFEQVRIDVYAEKDGCTANVSSDFREEANARDLLSDSMASPSFELDQCFHTVFNNKIKVYHNDDFKVNKITLTYYKEPKYIRFPNTFQPDGVPSSDDTWEFKNDFCELIIDNAVKILAGDIESINVYQVTDQRIKENE